MNRIYLDNAATTPLDPEVFAAMQPYFLDFPGNPSSTHSFGREARNELEQARKLISQHLNCKPYEIYFTSGGTEADNTAILGSVEGLEVRHIISTKIEHHAVSHPIEALEASGRVRATWLKVDRQGMIDYAELEESLKNAKEKTLVCLMHGNNEIGTLYDLERIGNLCREYGAYFHSDTVQTMCQFPLDLGSLPIDFATASAHKFNGPKGVGFLFVRKGINLPPLICGGGQERDRRAGTENLPSVMGMAIAFDKAYKHLDEKLAHLRGLKAYARKQLREAFPTVEFNGIQEDEQSLATVLNICFPVEDDLMLLFNLDITGIAASSGSACSSGALQGSHVLREIGASTGGVKNALRLSFGRQNTEADIDAVVNRLKEIVPVAAV